MSAKAPRYIRSQCSYEFKGKFDDYLQQLKLFFSEGERVDEKAHFSVECDDKEKFHFKYYTYEEVESLNKKEMNLPTFKNIKKYISNNSIALKKSGINDNKSQSSIDIKESETKNKIGIDTENNNKPAVNNNEIEIEHIELNEIKEKKNEEEIL